MVIDFHAGSNQYTYVRRVAHAGWGDFIQQRVDPAGKAIADIGFGGGIYSAAWAGLGARQVTGVDFSAQMLQDAQETVQGLTNVSFVQGDAAATGLADASQDIVFARALIHHFDPPHPFCMKHGASSRRGDFCGFRIGRRKMYSCRERPIICAAGFSICFRSWPPLKGGASPPPARRLRRR